MATRPRILVLTADKELPAEIAATSAARQYEVRAVSTAGEALAALGAPAPIEGAQGLVADLRRAGAEDVAALEKAAAGRDSVVLFLLRPDYPDGSAAEPLRRLGWPFPRGFVERVQGSPRPAVFLVDRALFASRLVQEALSGGGAQPIVLQSSDGVGEMLKRQRRPAAEEPPEGIWERWKRALGAATGGSEPGGSLLSHVAVARFDGPWEEAERRDSEIRATLPEALCYRVTSISQPPPAGALRERRPLVLMGSEARMIAAFLESRLSPHWAPAKPPILVVERDPDILGDVARHLLAAGYQVEISKDYQEALGLVRSRGQFHAAVVGLTFAFSHTYGLGAAEDFARRLRHFDPHMRFVFMVELYPLERAVREMSRAIEFGVDDAFVKPVDPARLERSVGRALSRRRLAAERARVDGRPEEGLELESASSPDLVAGRYDIVLQLGEGGMGVVYLAVDRTLGRKVALKAMRSELRREPDRRLKFIEEAKLISRLQHPGIVALHDVVDFDGELHLVLAFVDGQPLSELLARRKRLSWGESCRIMAQVFAAVAYAHARRVIHRDLKPSNIMIDSSGLAKVMDFGLAWEMKETLSVITQRDMGGTMAYMAPEQHVGRFGPGADVYSLGVCLYEMLTGAPPFRGPDFLAQKERKAFLAPSAVAADLPPVADEIIARLLEPEAAKRPQDAGELARWFEAARA